MSDYECLSLVISCVALCIAAWSMFDTKKLAKQQLELEHISASLSAKQLARLAQEDLAINKAKIDVAVDSVQGQSTYYVVISNVGQGEATDVNFSYEGDASIAGNEIRDKLPIKSLREGKKVIFTATRTYDTAATFTANVRWRNPDGSFGKDSFQLFT